MADLSLDEIIQQKRFNNRKIQPGRINGGVRNQTRSNTGVKNQARINKPGVKIQARINTGSGKIQKPQPLLSKPAPPVRWSFGQLPVAVQSAPKPIQNIQSNTQTVQVPGVNDMRNKIILKKRLRMVDARDRLAEIAKQGDARDRLNKIKKNRMMKTQGANVQQQKKPPPLMKKIHNENHPSNLSGQTKMKGTKLMRTVPSNQVGDKPVKTMGQQRNQAQHKASANGRMQGRQYPMPNNPHVVTIKNKKDFGGQGMRNQQMNKYPQRPVMQSSPMEPQYPTRGGGMMTRGGGGGGGGGGGYMNEDMYSSRSQMMQQDVWPTRLKITTSNNYRQQQQQQQQHSNRDEYYEDEQSGMYNDDWDMGVRMPVSVQRMPPPRISDPTPQRMAMRQQPAARKRSLYEDENELMRAAKKMAPLSTELLARLDQPTRTQPQGFKVLVTNLHPCVSVEDMEELFGTIGQIISAHMLRQGVAEILFVNQDDAFRSVEVFNHRQLDGQPMCVSVVGRQSAAASNTLPTQPPPQQTSHTTSVLKAASGGGGTVMPRGMMMRARRSDDIVAPNMAAIHQALFKHH